MERTSEIGTLRALGRRRAEIFKLFLLEGVALGTLSGLVGALVGAVLTGIIGHMGIEMPPHPGGTVAWVSTPSVNAASPRVFANREIVTANNTFGGGRGTETIWMIWTKAKNADLDGIVSRLVIPPGGVSESDTGTLRTFLEENSSEIVKANKDSAQQLTVVQGNGDTIVFRFALEHR